jgi:hypothetical protein
MRQWIVLGLMLSACATAPAPKPAAAATSAPQPQLVWTSVPLSVLQSLCGILRVEGVGGQVDVVKTSEPLITRESMQALAQAEFYRGRENPERFASSLQAASQTLPLERGSAGCEMRFVDAAGGARGDVMLLQVSAPFFDPFARAHGAGLFARVTLSGEAAEWFWIPLASRGGVWYAGGPLPLGVRN